MTSVLRSDTLAELLTIREALDSLAATLDASWVEIWRKENISHQIQAMREKMKKAEKTAERSNVKKVRNIKCSIYIEFKFALFSLFFE